ncbi:phosphohydrolase [Candidatus Magnetomorum sp. HK-1]|nr:phosphohydrolase [Candidatus Magnetomorum sp. HK-1]
MSKINYLFLFICLLFFIMTTGCKSNDTYAEEEVEDTADALVQEGLPVDDSSLTLMTQSTSYKPPVTYENLHNITTGDDVGLNIDLNDPDIWGKIYTGPYPFEAGDSYYDFPVYRIDSDINDGQGNLNIASFFTSKYDSNSWIYGGRSTATPTIAYRLELYSDKKILGMADSFVSFKKKSDGIFEKLPTIIEGPFVTSLNSDNPTAMEIVWRTDELCTSKVIFGNNEFRDDAYNDLHVVPIDNLDPRTDYEYYVTSVAQDGRTVVSNTYKVRTAPFKGKGDIKFVYTSDSYKAPGGGEHNYLGCNMDILRDIAANAYRDGAEYMIFGGDLVEGMSAEKEDIIIQYRAWKQIMSGFWHTRPVYPGMGNHEFVANGYENYVFLDKWPYETDSSEAIFSQEFYNPTNGPEPSDSRRPTYKENVYYFQHGPVLNISVNTNYWQSISFFDLPNSSQYGGAPMGYIMEDQLEWIEGILEDAENDDTIKFIFIYTHCPVLPYMRHIMDGMWWYGNNNVTAKTRVFNSDTQEYEMQSEPLGQTDPLGIIEVRDRFLTAVTNSSKVAAIFSSHEHGYHRTLISKYTPLGVFPDDDRNDDGVLEEPYSSNPKFKHATWHIMCGGGGSGFNSEVLGSTPWKPQRITSHTGYVMLETNDDKVGMKFIGGLAREVLDELDDLMAVKDSK